MGSVFDLHYGRSVGLGEQLDVVRDDARFLVWSARWMVRVHSGTVHQNEE